MVAEPRLGRGSAFLVVHIMFNFGKPKTTGDWIVHIAGAVVALLLVWWMLRMYVLWMPDVEIRPWRAWMVVSGWYVRLHSMLQRLRLSQHRQAICATLCWQACIAQAD